jgi:hypothetical protein
VVVVDHAVGPAYGCRAACIADGRRTIISTL